jgi:hypothetical protein
MTSYQQWVTLWPSSWILRSNQYSLSNILIEIEYTYIYIYRGEYIYILYIYIYRCEYIYIYIYISTSILLATDEMVKAFLYRPSILRTCLLMVTCQTAGWKPTQFPNLMSVLKVKDHRGNSFHDSSTLGIHWTFTSPTNTHHNNPKFSPESLIQARCLTTWSGPAMSSGPWFFLGKTFVLTAGCGSRVSTS